MGSNVLVIAGHPDDEILGCGGTILKHTKAGDRVNILIIAEGLTSRKEQRNRENLLEKFSSLHNAATNASKLLGVNKIELLDFPDNRLDSIELIEIVKVIEKRIDLFKPEIIYTHHHGDLNIDHQIINKAVITACRPLPLSYIKKILTFEVPSSTEWQKNIQSNVFIPNWFVNIEDELSMKLNALKEYKDEMREWPHPRSLRHVEISAFYRGAQVGIKAAEAFSLIRLIDK